jgi:uridylate kinase
VEEGPEIFFCDQVLPVVRHLVVEKNPDAERYTKLHYTDALSKQLKVMDAAAFSLCMENDIPIIVFNFFTPGSIEGVVCGEEIGTLVSK